MAVFLQFLGLIGSGKSFLADELARATDGCRVPFAREVYRLAEKVLGRPVDKRRQEDRELLKLIGTTWGRECSRALPPEILAKLDANRPKEWGGRDIWVRLFLRECASLPPAVSVFNDDTRFANELLVLSRRGGFIPVFVACSAATRTERLRARGDDHDANDASHGSEELVNQMAAVVLAEYIVPVVWNDDLDAMPTGRWIWGRQDFRELVLACATNRELASRLDWQPAGMRKLAHWVHEWQGACR